MSQNKPGRSVVLHADTFWHAAIRDGRIDFFDRLQKRLVAEAVPMRLVPLDGAASKVLLAQDHVNILVGGGPRAGRNLLHAGPAYVWGFWYLDPRGLHWRSSIRRADFEAQAIDGERAAYFFNGVTGHMLRENMSRSPQAARSDQEPAAAVIYCQEEAAADATCNLLTTEEMIRTTANAAAGLVYVKLHPDQSPATARRIAALVARLPNARLTGASVHDLNAAARVVVTQSSAAGFEALMQKKPVITCARTDFWHATLTPRSTADLADAVRYGPQSMEGFDYEAYFWWFLEGQCLEPQKAEFGDRVWARIRARQDENPARRCRA